MNSLKVSEDRNETFSWIITKETLKFGSHYLGYPVGKFAKKQSEEMPFFNSALKIQCHIVKNRLLQTAFSVILPTMG